MFMALLFMYVIYVFKVPQTGIDPATIQYVQNDTPMICKTMFEPL